jgi:hypothetical protein
MSAVKALWVRAFPTAESQAFLRWGLGAYGLITVVLLVAALRTSDGTMVYALDDPAIHLSVAQNLVDHGTWGVTPGHFQSASSSPLWTLLVAAFVGVAPFAADWAALVLNVAAFHLLLQERDRTRSRIRRLAPYLLVALATLTRLETAFLAAGLGAALLVTPPRWPGTAGRAIALPCSRPLEVIGLRVYPGS